MIVAHPLLASVQALHRRIRRDVVAACEQAAVSALSRVAREEEGDTIYAIDRVAEEVHLAPTFSAVRVADETGVTRARLAMAQHGCSLTFFGTDEEPRAMLRETNGFGQLVVQGRNIESRVDVRFSEEDHANIVVTTPAGVPCAVVKATDFGGTVSVVNGDGDPLIGLSANQTGCGELRVWKDGRENAELILRATGEGGFVVASDADGPRATLCAQKGKGAVMISGSDGEPRVAITAFHDSGVVKVWNTGQSGGADMMGRGEGGSFTVWSEGEKEVAALQSGESGGELRIFNREGDLRAVFSTPGGEALLTLRCAGDEVAAVRARPRRDRATRARRRDRAEPPRPGRPRRLVLQHVRELATTIVRDRRSRRTRSRAPRPAPDDDPARARGSIRCRCTG